MSRVVGKPHTPATNFQIAQLRALLNQEVLKDNGNDLLEEYHSLLSDHTLNRFLTARNGRVDIAFQMLLMHLAWRKSYGVDTILEEDFSDLDAQQEIFWLKEKDKTGHPVIVWRMMLHDQQFCAKDRMVRYFIYMLEKGIKLAHPVETFVMVLDCRGMRKKNLDFHMVKLASPIIENNYPERQFATYVLPVGSLITLAWKVIAGFLDPGTAYKIRLVTGFQDPLLLDNFDEKLLEMIERGNAAEESTQGYENGEHDAEEQELYFGTRTWQNDQVVENDESEAEVEIDNLDKEKEREFSDAGDSEVSALDDDDADACSTSPQSFRVVLQNQGSLESSNSSEMSPARVRLFNRESRQNSEGQESSLENYRRGSLYKMRKRIRNYRERYFILFPAEGHKPARLSYYPSSMALNTVPKTLFLEGCRVVLESSKDGHFQPFTVTSRNNDIWHLAANEAECAFEWVAAIACASIPEIPQIWHRFDNSRLLDPSSVHPREGAPLALEKERFKVLGPDKMLEELSTLRDWQSQALKLMQEKDSSYDELMKRYHAALAINTQLPDKNTTSFCIPSALGHSISLESKLTSPRSTSPRLRKPTAEEPLTPETDQRRVSVAKNFSFKSDTNVLNSLLKPEHVLIHSQSLQSQPNILDHSVMVQDLPTSAASDSAASKNNSVFSLKSMLHKRKGPNTPTGVDEIRTKFAQLEIENFQLKEGLSTMTRQLQLKTQELLQLSTLSDNLRNQIETNEREMALSFQKLDDDNRRLRTQTMQLEAQAAGLQMEKEVWKGLITSPPMPKRKGARFLRRPAPGPHTRILNRKKTWVSSARSGQAVAQALDKQLLHVVSLYEVAHGISKKPPGDKKVNPTGGNPKNNPLSNPFLKGFKTNPTGGNPNPFLNGFQIDLLCGTDEGLIEMDSSLPLTLSTQNTVLLDYAWFRASEDFQDLILDLSELQKVSWKKVPHHEQQDFFNTILKLLTFQASVTFGVSRADVVENLSSVVAYDIGGAILTAADIQAKLRMG